jgi:hypothetical protein
VIKKKRTENFVLGLRRSFKAVNKQLRVSIDLIIVLLRLYPPYEGRFLFRLFALIAHI